MDFDFDTLHEPLEQNSITCQRQAQDNANLADNQPALNNTQTSFPKTDQNNQKHESILDSLNYGQQNAEGIVSMDALEQIADKSSDNAQSSALTFYHQEYCRLFLANIALTNQVKELIEEKSHFKYRLSKYEDQECFSSFERNEKASKRFRRNAHEIERFYKCTVKSCGKSYGSQGSLNQHYKLKHPDVYVQLPNVQTVTGGMREDGESSQVQIHVKAPMEKQPSKKESNKQARNNSASKNKRLNTGKHVLQQIDSNCHMTSNIYNGLACSPLPSMSGSSNNKINSILKEFGEHNHSFKSIKIEELKFDEDLHDPENREDKENKCGNAFHNINVNESNKKPYLGGSHFQNDENCNNKVLNGSVRKTKPVKGTSVTPVKGMSVTGVGNLKRSSRVVKKREFC